MHDAVAMQDVAVRNERRSMVATSGVLMRVELRFSVPVASGGVVAQGETGRFALCRQLDSATIGPR